MFSTIGKLSRIIITRTNFKNNLRNEKVSHRNRLHLGNRKCLSTVATVQNEDLNDNRVNIELIAGNDPELKHKLQVLILETEVMRQEGRLVPEASFLTEQYWRELLKFPSRSGRAKYLQFLFKLEKKKENDQIRKEKKKQERAEHFQNLPKVDDSHILYGLSHNNIFIRFYDTKINHFFNGKLIQAMQFGQKVIVDCGYDKNMVTRESINCAKQLMLLFSDNRADSDPFDLHFCNVNHDSMLMKALNKQIVTLYEPSFPLHLHASTYTKIFPKEKLVYLTPHTRNVMTDYDHDAIYIIGGIVDKINNEPLSLAKAKKDGIKMEKFPLDKYLHWGAGSKKTLTLNQVMCILLDMKRTNDWAYALRHVPKRKLFSTGNIPPALNVLRKDNSKDQRNFNPSDKQKKLSPHVKIRSLFNE